MKAEKIIHTLKNLLTLNLDELNAMTNKNQFILGEITAYTECMEVLTLFD
ncbi:MAG: hypothetical protein IJV95_00825 [Clostridia bacterium]|nr:hypothetical protein [Clostridia bacterium]